MFNGPVRGSRSRGVVKIGLFELAIIMGRDARRWRALPTDWPSVRLLPIAFLGLEPFLHGLLHDPIHDHAGGPIGFWISRPNASFADGWLTHTRSTFLLARFPHWLRPDFG
jgi:hypothetical protein